MLERRKFTTTKTGRGVRKMPEYHVCPQCGSVNATLVSKVPVFTAAQFLDYVITWRCTDCGKSYIVGDRKV